MGHGSRLAMDLGQIRHFLCVAQHGNLSKAADALNMSQPGLTKSIRSLENRLGVALFVRRARGVDLTVYGSALLEHARAIDLQLRDARTEIRDLVAGAVGRIVVGAGPSWLGSLLPRAVSMVLAERPGLTVKIVGGFNDMLTRGLLAGDLDMVVAALPDGPAQPGLVTYPLTRDTMTVVASEDHPLAGRKNVSLADLLDWQWVLPGPEALSRSRLAALFLAQGLPPPTPSVEYDSLSFMLAIVGEGTLLSFANRQVLKLEEARGLVALDVTGGTTERVAGIITRKGEPARPCRLLIDRLRALAEETPCN